MLPTKDLSKILREELYIQNSHSNGLLTSFDVLITARWFGPTAELFVDSVHREMNWKILVGFNEGNMLPL